MDSVVWEVNRGFMYDVVLTYALEWPSLTVDWLPNFKSTTEDTEIYYLLCATHTSGQEKEYLMQLEVHIPCKDSATDQVTKALDIFPTKLLVPSAGLQRTRHNPLKPGIVGCTNETSEVFIYDLTDIPEPDGFNYRQLYSDKLKYVGVGQTTGGFALDWNPMISNHLLTGTEDGYIYHYDFNHSPAAKLPSCLLDIEGTCDTSAVKFNHRYCHSTDGQTVNAVSWAHEPNGMLFGSAGDDGRVCLWDMRTSTASGQFQLNQISSAPVGEVRCLSFCPSDDHLFATGDDSGMARIWDTRMNKNSVLMLNHSTDRFDNVYSTVTALVVGEVNWVPGAPNRLATTVTVSSIDRLKKHKEVSMSEQYMWDLALACEENGNGSSEEDGFLNKGLLFAHHNVNFSEITDSSVSKAPRNLVANVDSENMLGLWRMADELNPTN